LGSFSLPTAPSQGVVAVSKDILDKTWTSFKKEQAKKPKHSAKTSSKEDSIKVDDFLSDHEKERLGPAEQVMLQSCRRALKEYKADNEQGRPVRFVVQLVSCWKDCGEKTAEEDGSNLTAAYVAARKSFVKLNQRDDKQYRMNAYAVGAGGGFYRLSDKIVEEQIAWEEKNLCDR